MRERKEKGSNKRGKKEERKQQENFLLNALILENGITIELQEHFIIGKLLVQKLGTETMYKWQYLQIKYFQLGICAESGSI